VGRSFDRRQYRCIQTAGGDGWNDGALGVSTLELAFSKRGAGSLANGAFSN
jgi:hypothetical protein